jgi:hypothetical protein
MQQLRDPAHGAVSERCACKGVSMMPRDCAATARSARGKHILPARQHHVVLGVRCPHSPLVYEIVLPLAPLQPLKSFVALKGPPCSKFPALLAGVHLLCNLHCRRIHQKLQLRVAHSAPYCRSAVSKVSGVSKAGSKWPTHDH